MKSFKGGWRHNCYEYQSNFVLDWRDIRLNITVMIICLI